MTKNEARKLCEDWITARPAFRRKQASAYLEARRLLGERETQRIADAVVDRLRKTP